MLTIAKMHGESVAYYESTVEEDQDENLGPDGYYSEDGTKPAEAWVNARTDAQAAAVAEAVSAIRNIKARRVQAIGFMVSSSAISGESICRFVFE